MIDSANVSADFTSVNVNWPSFETSTTRLSSLLSPSLSWKTTDRRRTVLDDMLTHIQAQKYIPLWDIYQVHTCTILQCPLSAPRPPPCVSNFTNHNPPPHQHHLVHPHISHGSHSSHSPLSPISGNQGVTMHLVAMATGLDVIMAWCSYCHHPIVTSSPNYTCMDGQIRLFPTCVCIKR